jgi:ribosomal protein S16
MAKDNFKRIDKGISLKPHDTEPAIIPSHDGRIYYDNNLKKARIQVNDTWSNLGGGGLGVINFIDNPDAESGLEGYVLYQDAAQQIPEDGTGGAPAGITFTKTTNPNEVLYELGSFKISKDASDRQGMGVSYDFKISKGYRNRTHFVNFIYSTSANFMFGDSYANPSDIGVFMYDMDNSKLIPMSTNWIGGGGNFLASFTPEDLNAENYRLIFHIATTSALDYDMILDTVVVGPNSYVSGSVQTTLQPYVPTFQGVVVNSTDVHWCRDGEFLEVIGTFNVTSLNASEFRMSLPQGLTVSSKIPSLQVLNGSSHIPNTGSLGWCNDPQWTASPGNTYVTIVGPAAVNVLAASGNQVDAIIPSTCRVSFRVPIQGWDSGMILSSESTNRMVVFEANPSGASSGNGDATFPNILTDTVNGWDTTTNNRYIIKEPGYYICRGRASGTNNGRVTANITVNGVTITSNTAYSASGFVSDAQVVSSPTFLKSGDYVQLNVSTIPSSGTSKEFSIYKLATPQTIAFDGNRVAYLSYKSSSGGGSATGGGVFDKLNINTLEGDTSFVSLNSNEFSLQPGKYTIEIQAPAYAVRGHIAKLVDITATPTDISIGSAGYQETTVGGTSHSFIKEQLTISVPRTYEVRHATQDARATIGFGFYPAFMTGPISYVQIKITKLA